MDAPLEADPAVLDTLRRMLEAECDPGVVARAEREWPASLWSTLEATGMPRAWLPESCGGAGASLADGFAIARTAARYAAPVPLVETLLAGWTLAQAGREAPLGPLSVALPGARDALELSRDGVLHGGIREVPFASVAQSLVVVSDGSAGVAVCLVRADRCRITPGLSLAGEPRDDISFVGVLPDAIETGPPSGVESVRRMGAALRAQQIAGALEHVLGRSIGYAEERVQFGRPIAKFQAVQHGLAELAAEVAAAGAAADAAAGAVIRHGIDDRRTFIAVASAKIRCGQAASSGAAIAHQVHGAIGFAREYPLHLYTRRLWTWRDDFGAETEWAEELGSLIARLGPEALWPSLTALGSGGEAEPDVNSAS